MRRREFIALVGAASAWSGMAYAQQRARRISVLMVYEQGDKEGQSSVAALEQGLRDLGWTSGNLVIDYGWTAGQVTRINMLAEEAVKSRPDLIISHATPATAAVRKLTRTLPIVFVAASDPVGDGFIGSLSQPGGNLTGFINIEDSMGGKWVEILKEIDARVNRVALMFNPDTAPAKGRYFEASFYAAAKHLNIKPVLSPVRSDADIGRVIIGLGREPGGALIATADGFNVVHRTTIITEAARNGLPAIYHLAVSAREGGLVTYGANTQDIFRRSATYVDRILRGESPSNLPAQVPTKFQFVINLKVANALGLTVPPTLLARADEVIE